MTERDHYSTQEEMRDVLTDHADAAVHKDEDRVHILHLWVEYLLLLPRNRKILQQLHDVHTPHKH